MVFNEGSLSDPSKKNSRNWTGKHPSRSGYLAHPSHTDDNDIPLKGRDGAFAQVHVARTGDLSPSGSMAGLRDWEADKDMDKSFGEGMPSGGIMKTVKITQS